MQRAHAASKNQMLKERMLWHPEIGCFGMQGAHA